MYESNIYLKDISRFSPPHTSIFISYVPNFSKYFLSIENKPPAIIGVLMIPVGSVRRAALSGPLKYSHWKYYNFYICIIFKKMYVKIKLTLKTKFQSKPPLRSAEAPIYWKVSILITSMTGHTTRVGSWNNKLFI